MHACDRLSTQKEISSKVRLDGKLRVLLLRSSLIKTNFVPLGLCYIGAVLERMGYSVKIVDMANENLSVNGLYDILFAYKPDIIGIGAMNIEFKHVMKITSFCKKYFHNIRIVLGGPISVCIHDSFACKLLRPFVDVIVIGEGETITVELLDKMEHNESLKNVKGIAYWSDGALRINLQRKPVYLDDLPFPARHLLNMDKYISSLENWFGDVSIRATNMIASRGCPYTCIYCDKHVFGDKWRGRNPSNIVDEMQFLVERYKVSGIIFNDDEFDVNKKWVNQLCDEITQRGLDIAWGCNSRCNHADREIYDKMYKSGCRFVAFGIEFGNQEMLNFTRKGFTVKQIIDAVKIAKESKLRATGYFMIGMLGENKQMIKETMKLATKLKLNSGAFVITSPIPGTDLYEMALKEGMIKNRWWCFNRAGKAAVNLTQDLTLEQLNSFRNQAYWELFWNSPDRRLPDSINKILSRLSPLIAYADLDKMIYNIEKIRKALRIRLP